MQNARILIADDEKEILELVKRYLVKEGYQVDLAVDGRNILNRFQEKSYDLVILDIMMPGIDGIEVLRRLRNETNIPVIMLTARDDETDKVLGLGMGADDYITKPFTMKELLARVRANLRRYLILGGSNEPDFFNKNVLIYGDIEIDLDKFRVLKRGEEIHLTAKEFQLLKLLATKPGHVFTKKQILGQVWEDEFVDGDNTVMVHIRRLRKKLEDDPEKPKYIQTVWGIGYKFAED